MHKKSPGRVSLGARVWSSIQILSTSYKAYLTMLSLYCQAKNAGYRLCCIHFIGRLSRLTALNQPAHSARVPPSNRPQFVPGSAAISTSRHGPSIAVGYTRPCRSILSANLDNEKRHSPDKRTAPTMSECLGHGTIPAALQVSNYHFVG